MINQETENLGTLPEDDGWKPDSWQSLEAKQQATYPDDKELQAALVELQGDKNDVGRKVKKGKQKIDSVTDEQLGIDYAGKLSDVPKRKSTRKK